MLEIFLISLFLQYAATASSGPKSVFAHMMNTKGAIKWALSEGANGVELDLQFTKEGYPMEFRHGGICDCTCTCLAGCTDYGVCSVLWAEGQSHCGASTPAEELTTFLGSNETTSKLAIIYIDSKLDNSMTDYYSAGQNVVKLLDRNVFKQGYKGQVIINAPKVEFIDYLKGALAAAKESVYGNQYFYTVDCEGIDYMLVWNTLLTLGTKNIVYWTGLTVCVNISFKLAIQGSIAQDGYAEIGIWTVDKRYSMEEYISYGVTAIMSNIPSRAVEAFGKENIAKPGEALVPVKGDLPFKESHSCECSYRNDNLIKLWGGGCIVTTMPPAGYACKCTMSVPYTCKGTVVQCLDVNSSACKAPTPNKDMCVLGGGDCDGY